MGEKAHINLPLRLHQALLNPTLAWLGRTVERRTDVAKLFMPLKLM